MRTLLNLLILAVVLPLTGHASRFDLGRAEQLAATSREVFNLFQTVEIQEEDIDKLPLNGRDKLVNDCRTIYWKNLCKPMRDRLSPRSGEPSAPMYSCILLADVFCKVKVTGTFGTLRRWWSKFRNGSPKRVMMNPTNVISKQIFDCVFCRTQKQEIDIADLDKLFFDGTGLVYQYLQPGDDLCYFVGGECFLVI